MFKILKLGSGKSDGRKPPTKEISSFLGEFLNDYHEGKRMQWPIKLGSEKLNETNC